MLRTLLPSLKPADLLLGDRFYANYWIIALALSLGIHVVFRQHQLRKVDFRRGRRLGLIPSMEDVCDSSRGRRPLILVESPWKWVNMDATVAKCFDRRSFRERSSDRTPSSALQSND